MKKLFKPAVSPFWPGRARPTLPTKPLLGRVVGFSLEFTFPAILPIGHILILELMHLARP